MAIGAAAQFETMLRQKDVIGHRKVRRDGAEVWSGDFRWENSVGAGKSSRRVVSAFIATAFAQDSAAAAKTQWRKVADKLRPKLPKLAAFMDEAEEDALAYMGFPADHWPKIHSTNGLERLNGEVKRRTEV